MALSVRLTNLAERICAANGTKSGKKSANKRASRVTPPHLHADDRIWPPMSSFPEPPAAKARQQPYLEELSGRDFAVAGPGEQQAEQTEELRRACDQIDHLIATINALRLEADRRDIEIATATQKQIEADSEISELKAALAAERQKTTALSQRLLEVESTLNDRLVDFTIHRDTADRLSNELILARTEAPKALAAVEVRAHRLFAEQVARITERHELEVQELRSALAGRNQDNDRLERAQAEHAMLFCALSDKIAGLETEKQRATEAIHAQAGQIEFIETAAVIERQNAEATIKTLAAEFGREREQLLARENAAAEIRKNIVQLLPRLIARRDAAEPDAAQLPEVIDRRAGISFPA